MSGAGALAPSGTIGKCREERQFENQCYPHRAFSISLKIIKYPRRGNFREENERHEAKIMTVKVPPFIYWEFSRGK